MNANSFGSWIRSFWDWILSVRKGIPIFCKKNKNFSIILGVFIAMCMLISWASTFSESFNPKVFLSKESADAAKLYILSFGLAAPAFFISVQIAQVIIAPIPGQATGFVGGYVFGWEWGTTYTMVGLTLGSVIVFILSRKFGRGFVEKLNGPEAMKDFEELFFPQKSKAGELYRAISSYGLLTFFMIMLLPALPDDLVCFIVGLTTIPIWKLTIATFFGRLPGMLVLSLVGDGFSKAESDMVLYMFIAVTVVCTAFYFWKKHAIEEWMKNAAIRLSGG